MTKEHPYVGISKGIVTVQCPHEPNADVFVVNFKKWQLVVCNKCAEEIKRECTE